MKNLESGYLKKTIVKSLLKSCPCLLSACGCSPGCCLGPMTFKMTESEGCSETVLCLDYGILSFPVAWRSETGCGTTEDQWGEVSSSLQRIRIPLQSSVLMDILHYYFTLKRFYDNVSHRHSITHTAQETLKNDRCLPTKSSSFGFLTARLGLLGVFQRLCSPPRLFL